MSKIQVLDQVTIDKIAAGEVIERPASIVKELSENAIDAGATAIVVEIKDGGISFIRITDNGCGIDQAEVPSAFLRHATSKIRSVDDLTHIASLGFRGEALSSISAVAQVELITKTRESQLGTSYRIEGGKELSLDEAGAPEGTTFLIRQLFYNTPARRKFLKTAVTEASHVGELVTRLALSHPEISFQFINNGQSKLHTSGNGKLKDVIYHIYGREIAAHLLEVNYEQNGIRISGFVGEPLISRGNRNFENYFINGRYVKSNIISKAIEDAYKDFTMQHRYPFTVLHMDISGETIDVNVHPTKMELRFDNQQHIYNMVCESVHKALLKEERIPHIEVPDAPKAETVTQPNESREIHPKLEENAPKITERALQNTPGSERSMGSTGMEKQSAVGNKDLNYFMDKMKERVMSYHKQNSSAEVKDTSGIFKAKMQADRIRETANYAAENASNLSAPTPEVTSDKKQPEQLNLFDEKLLAGKEKPDYTLIGQVFHTYWLVQLRDNLYIIDQHAAHERVLYEQTLASMKTREFTSQNISPPIILDLSMKEAELLNTYMEQFSRIGFEIEEFGQESYAVRAIPDNLFSIAKKDLLLEMLDSLSDEVYTGLSPDIVDEKIASMSCKAAVKGNMRLSEAEMDALIGQLLDLENPYHCPHGRPTIVTMTKRDLEKKFKRIV